MIVLLDSAVLVAIVYWAVIVAILSSNTTYMMCIHLFPPSLYDHKSDLAPLYLVRSCPSLLFTDVFESVLLFDIRKNDDACAKLKINGFY